MKTIFFDVDTQIDFLYPAGALYVPGAENVVSNIAALNHFAGRSGHRLISTVDAHAENDLEFHSWPPHCVAGTTGQQKPTSTLLDKRIVIANVPGALGDVAAQQIVVEKQTVDCFQTVHLAALLERLATDRYVVYGVVAEICVRYAAQGLLATGKRVELVRDALRSLNADASAVTLAAFQAQGGVLTSLAEITGGAQ